MAERKWRVRLSAAAELDFARIVRWTVESFGDEQARTYKDTVLGATDELANGPDVSGAKARDDIMPGLRSLHVARHGRRGRHLLLYRVGHRRVIEIVRILHDSMDLQLHIRSHRNESNEYKVRRVTDVPIELWRVRERVARA